MALYTTRKTLLLTANRCRKEPVFGSELIYKTERPKIKVMREIDSVYEHDVWENYLDIFAPMF